jgi:hypothetical protein
LAEVVRGRQLDSIYPPQRLDYVTDQVVNTVDIDAIARWCRQTERLRCTAVLGSRYLFVGDWGSPVFGDVVAGTAGLTSSGLHGCTAGGAGGRCC